MVAALCEFCWAEDGATAIEYGLIAALVVITLIVGLRDYARETVALYDFVETSVTNASGS
jgi:pilus assembly protein Flp/PilA